MNEIHGNSLLDKIKKAIFPAVEVTFPGNITLNYDLYWRVLQNDYVRRGGSVQDARNFVQGMGIRHPTVQHQTLGVILEGMHPKEHARPHLPRADWYDAIIKSDSHNCPAKRIYLGITEADMEGARELGVMAFQARLDRSVIVLLHPHQIMYAGRTGKIRDALLNRPGQTHNERRVVTTLYERIGQNIRPLN